MDEKNPDDSPARRFANQHAATGAKMDQAAAFIRDHLSHLAAAFYFGLQRTGLPDAVTLELTKTWLNAVVRTNLDESGGQSGSGGAGDDDTTTDTKRSPQ